MASTAIKYERELLNFEAVLGWIGGIFSIFIPILHILINPFVKDRFVLKVLESSKLFKLFNFDSVSFKVQKVIYNICSCFRCLSSKKFQLQLDMFHLFDSEIKDILSVQNLFIDKINEEQIINKILADRNQLPSSLELEKLKEEFPSQVLPSVEMKNGENEIQILNLDSENLFPRQLETLSPIEEEIFDPEL